MSKSAAPPWPTWPIWWTRRARVEIGGVRDQLLLASATAPSRCASIRRWASPSAVLPGMLFFHGGGWVAGSLETHDGSAAGWPTKPAAA